MGTCKRVLEAVRRLRSAGMLLAGVLLAGVVILAGIDSAAWADPGLTVGVDVNPDATPPNTATSLGSIEYCRRVNVNETFKVDLWIRDVADLKGWQATVRYAGGVLNLTGIDDEEFQAADPESNVLSLSDPVPDADGEYLAAAVDLETPDTGTGRLAILTFHATAAGQSAVSLDGIILANSLADSMGDTNGDGFYDGALAQGTIVVGAALDTDGDTLPDVCDRDDDNDSVLDDGDGSGTAGDHPCTGGATVNCDDNCRVLANANQADADSDGVGDACESAPVGGIAEYPVVSPEESNGASIHPVVYLLFAAIGITVLAAGIAAVAVRVRSR